MINETKQVNTHRHVFISPRIPPLSLPVRPSQFHIGVSLALASSLFIGTSFILKKKGLLKLTTHHGAIRAGSGGFGYLRELQWWTGLITMGLGELCNFAAYGFAPASVVTPLGALSVLVSTLMSVRFLGEKLNLLGKIGCLLTVCGSIVIVIHAPKETEIHSLLDFSRKIGTTEFLFFSSFTGCSIICLILSYAPRLGSKYVHIYILICSLFGAYTVTACKGLSIGLKEIIHSASTYSKWLTLFCAITILVCIIFQMIYLNRALDLFSTPIVTTVYYVLFTTCVLISSGILFREWQKLTLTDLIACLAGFTIITCGLILINNIKTNIQSNDSLFTYLSSNSPSSTTTGNVKEQQQIKSYANLLSDEKNFNSLNEQRQPILLIDERDFCS